MAMGKSAAFLYTFKSRGGKRVRIEKPLLNQVINDTFRRNANNLELNL